MRIVITALWLLGGVGAAAPPWRPLVAALNSADHKVRVKAARGLARFREQPAQAALRAALRDEAATVRAAAALSLGAGSDPEAISPLCRAQADGDPLVKAAAISALKRFGGDRACDGSQTPVRFEVTAEAPGLAERVQAGLEDRAARHPSLVVSTAQTQTRGVTLKVRLRHRVKASPGKTMIHCEMAMSVIETARQAIRGTATQRAAVEISGSALTPPELDTEIHGCVDALVPVTLAEISSYAARRR